MRRIGHVVHRPPTGWPWCCQCGAFAATLPEILAAPCRAHGHLFGDHQHRETRAA